jgi:uncharacterized membrane protein
MKHATVSKSAYFAPALVTTIAAMLTLFFAYQHACCGSSMAWVNMFLIISAIGTGWGSIVYYLRKWGRFPWQQ